ncbi:GDP-fucose transporter [Rhizoctonia solani AG-3 Rhs1AP]|uniref:GDP-fucose transporter n=2 Tax=Rhizoctonia solani AG-3 TaxID=1086053 RepID=A0A074RY51_9AGAM|nr:GDP-fucose transporter [Rhizoctonia solani AG-3 Rhs1AP]KEP50225.1 GDP-fucose transporter [Rhizoctonia solani 123E]
MPADTSNEKPVSRVKVAATVVFYLVAAIAMVVANKWVLNETKTPLFFLLAQLVIACVLFLMCHVFGLLKLPRNLDMQTVKGLAPLIACNVLGLSFNNYCLKYVDASFYQVARGLVLPITVATSAVIIHSRPSLKVLGACALVTAGFFVGVLLDRSASPAGTTSSPSTIGIFFGVLSSFTTALLAVVIKSCLPVVGNSALDLAWYNNLLSAVVLAPIIVLVGEGPDVMDLLFGAASATKTSSGMTAFDTFIYGSAITGLFGFLINIAGFMSIKVTSPITHMVSSAVKGVLQSILGVWFFHDVISGGRGTSILLILLGSIYYTWVKNQEVVERERKESLPMSNASKGAYESVPTKERE